VGPAQCSLVAKGKQRGWLEDPPILECLVVEGWFSPGTLISRNAALLLTGGIDVAIAGRWVSGLET